MANCSRIVTGFILFSLSASSQASLPFSFSAGTPAKASQVNANFSALDNRVSAVEGSGSGTSCGVHFGDIEPFHAYTYSYVDLPVGAAITVGTKKYEIAKIPFVEFKTGGHYAIKMPVEVAACSGASPPACAGTYVYTANVSVYHVKGACGYSDIFSGFPAAFYTNDSLNFDVSGNNIAASLKVSSRVSMMASVVINETAINLYYFVDDMTQSTTSTTPSDRDFTDNINWLEVMHPDQHLAQATQLMNYVKIEKLP